MEPTIPSREAVDFRWYCEEYLTTEKGQPLDFKERVYLHDIYDCVARDMVIKKSAQVGISGFAVNKTLHLADNMALTIIYVLPTKGLVSVFSKARFNPITTNSKIRKRMEVDSVGLKHIGNSFIYFRGAYGETEAISVPSDFNVIDELDKCKPDVVESYNERLSASPLKLTLKLSTPTIPDYGIDAEFKKSDRREWMVKCRKCGHDQFITDNHIDYDRNAYVCEKAFCKTQLIVNEGRWVAQAKSDVVGFHPTQLICPWITPREIIDKKNDYEFPADYANFVQGEAWAGGDAKVARADILAVIRDSVPTMGTTTMGVDWGDTSWYVLRKPGRVFHYGKIEGDTRTHAGQVLEIADKFKVGKLMMDSGYGDIKNMDVIDRRPAGTTFMVTYGKDGKYLYPKFDEKSNTVIVDRTRSLQLRMYAIKEQRVQIQRNDEIQEEFIQHYCNLFEKKEKDDHGQVITTVENKGPDHLAHADNYAALPEIKKVGSSADIILL